MDRFSVVLTTVSFAKRNSMGVIDRSSDRNRQQDGVVRAHGSIDSTNVMARRQRNHTVSFCSLQRKFLLGSKIYILSVMTKSVLYVRRNSITSSYGFLSCSARSRIHRSLGLFVWSVVLCCVVLCCAVLCCAVMSLCCCPNYCLTRRILSWSRSLVLRNLCI